MSPIGSRPTTICTAIRSIGSGSHQGDMLIGSKKVAQLPPLSTMLVPPDPAEEQATTLEVDELWSFMLK